MSNKAEMKTKMPYSAPDGYLENLQTRLSEIPERESGRSFRTMARPCLALAASIAVTFLVGNTVLRKTATPAANPDEEEIVDFLIDSGTNVEDLYL